MATPALAHYDTSAYLASGAAITSNPFTTTVGGTALAYIALDENALPETVIDKNGQVFSLVPPSVGGVNYLYNAAGPSLFTVYQFPNNQFTSTSVVATWSGSNSALNIHCEDWINVPATGADSCNFVYQTTPGT